MSQRFLVSLNLWIRSAIVLVGATFLIVLYFFLVMMALVLPLRYRHALIRSFVRNYFFLLKHICHIDYQIEGLEHLPKNQNGIILSKHQSTWETFALPLIFHDPAIILKRELLWVPFFGWGLAAASPIAIDRSNKSSAMTQILEKGTACLKSGRWIMMFPEGTRIPYGKVGHYKVGGARLAVVSGYPIVPVAHNAGYYWPKRGLIKRPGTIRLVIGPMIEPQGKTAEEVLTLTKNWIETTMVRIDCLIDKTTGG